MPDGLHVSFTEPTHHPVDADQPLRPGPSQSGVQPSPSIESTSDDHSRSLRRIFIGLMPLSHAIPSAQSSHQRFWFRSARPLSSSASGMSEEEERRNLRNLFLRRGGRHEEWEAEEGKKFRINWGFFGNEAVGEEEGKGKGANGSGKRDWIGRTFEIGKEYWDGQEEGAPLPSLRVEPTPSDRALVEIRESAAEDIDASEPQSQPPAVIDDPPDTSRPSPPKLSISFTSPPPLPRSSSSYISTNTYTTARQSQLAPSEAPLRPPSPSLSSNLIPSPGSSPPANRASMSSTRPLISAAPPPSIPPSEREVPDSVMGKEGPRRGPLRALRSALRTKLDSPTSKDKLKGTGLRKVTFPPGTRSPPPHQTQTQNGEIESPEPSPSGAQDPAPPREVLARTGSEIGGTSASAAASADEAAEEGDGPEEEQDVVMRDRMLLKASYTRSEDLPRLYDEDEARRHPEARGEDWGEYLVVWRGRKDRIEVYEDYTFLTQEYFASHKRLAFVIPLSSSRDTHLSLYSATDLTFCVTCAPTPTDTTGGKTRELLHLSRTGTNVFVFKARCRSRAVDWMWKLWLHLGGVVPPHIDVQCPLLDTRVRLFQPSPSVPLTRSLVLSTCLTSLSTVPDWSILLEKPLKEGAKVELCWRRGTMIDWVWLGSDVQGRRRYWEVLSGLALRQVRNPMHLEIRLAHHYPTRLKLSDGSTLAEPAAIEGFLHRITPATSRFGDSRRRIYLSSHDGNLMFIAFSHAHPPVPPVVPPSGQTDSQRRAAWAAFHAADIRRQAENVMAALEYVDFRDVLAVRRAETLRVVKQQLDVAMEEGNIPEVHEGWEEEMAEHDDDARAEQGGEDGGTVDRQSLRLARSFELLMRSGHVLRFEARTRKHANEWMSRLKMLASYWTRQHRVWARFEMDVTYGVEGDGHSEGPTRTRQPTGWYPRPKEPEDPDAASPMLAQYWHWCVLDGCRAIVKAGRLFQKRGPRKQFRHMYHILVQGHLLQFKLTTASAVTHRLANSIPLAHAYVYSGQLAVMSLPQSPDDLHGRIVPRYYQDGLEAKDTDEDTTFVIWYHRTDSKVTPVTAPPGDTTASAHADSGETPSRKDIPPLGRKHETLILRARSRLERDAWCWAINVEIEKLVRASGARERALREEGGVIP